MVSKNGYYSGHIGQLDATFAANQDIVLLIREKHKLYDFKGLIKIGIQAPVGTKMMINGEPVRIGATGIYELDQIVNVKELYFVEDTDALVDYVY